MSYGTFHSGLSAPHAMELCTTFSSANIRHIRVINFLGVFAYFRFDLGWSTGAQGGGGLTDERYYVPVGNYIQLDWNNSNRELCFVHNGNSYWVKELSLNDGSNNDDIKPYPAEHDAINLRYKAGKNESNIAFLQLAEGVCGSCSDDDGIAGVKPARVRSFYNAQLTGLDTIHVYVERT